MAADDNTTGLRVASFSCYLSNPQESFVQKIKGAVEPAVISPPDDFASLHVESFSSYVKTGGDNFAFKAPGGPVQDPTIAFVFPQQAKHLERTKSKDAEISIFGADKYFNMELDNGAAPREVKYRGKLDVGMTMDRPQTKSNFYSGTPSIGSESSSWNSQNALLQNIRQNGYQTKQKKTVRMRFLDNFGCQPCSDKKAVYVDKSIGHGLSKPFALSSGAPYIHSLSIEEQRKSLEVFGSKRMGKGDVALNLERKLSMLTWDAIPKAQNLPTTTNGSSTVCDDLASDASSDLFEIENISSSGYGLVNAENLGDYTSSCMSPTTQYAPSEASIEWSVVTASAADYSSIISDYDEKNFGFTVDKSSRNAANKTKNPVSREGQKTRTTTGLLGCKSQKAVSVAETVHKPSEKAKQR